MSAFPFSKYPLSEGAREVLELTSEGIWLSNDSEITHEGMKKLFFQSIEHDDFGYRIRIGNEQKRVIVQDTAYFVQAVDRTEGALQISMSDGQKEQLSPQTLRYEPGRLTCEIQRGPYREKARFLRSAYHDLLKDLEEDEKGYYLELHGEKIRLHS